MPEAVTSIAEAHAVKLQSSSAALAHLTREHQTTTTEASALLEEIAVASARLSDALRAIGNGMRVTLTTHDVVADDDSDPTRNVIAAQSCLQVAADQLAQTAENVWEAHDRISGIGVRGLREDPFQRDEIAF